MCLVLRGGRQASYPLRPGLSMSTAGAVWLHGTGRDKGTVGEALSTGGDVEVGGGVEGCKDGYCDMRGSGMCVFLSCWAGARWPVGGG